MYNKMEEQGKIAVTGLVLGLLQTNCYLLENRQTKEAVIIDPADKEERICKLLEERGLVPKAVLMTHGHFDHGLAASGLSSRFDIPVCAYPAEKELLADEDMNCSNLVPGTHFALEPQEWLRDGQTISPAGFAIQVIHTPGHTCGSCCFYIPECSALVSGDTLFLESVGRTDMPTGSMGELLTSIREKLLLLPEQTVVYPGHGETTTIENEKMNNPYLSEEGFWNE